MAKAVKTKQPIAEPADRCALGPAQVRLLKFIMKKPGCTMDDICIQEFPDKHRNHVWNLLAENKKYIEKREIGGDLPNQFYVIMSEFTKVVDFNHYIVTGNFRMPHPPAAPTPPTPENNA
jgi:hypothetical protein